MSAAVIAALGATLCAILALRELLVGQADRARRPPEPARSVTGANRRRGGLGVGRRRARQAADGTGTAPPTRLVALLLATGRRVIPLPMSADLGRRLQAAGTDLNVSDARAIKAGSAVLALLLGTLIAPLLPGRLPLTAVLAAPLVGFCAPDLWLRRRTGDRRRAMEAELADVLELLRVAITAGMSAERAMAEVGRRHSGTLAAELTRTARTIGLGVPVSEALDRLAARCTVDGIPVLCAALRRAARHGAPLGPALQAQAMEARALRSRARIDAAMRSAPKIQLVVALLIVPSVLLLIAAAVVPPLLVAL